MAPIPGDQRAPNGAQAAFDRASKAHGVGDTAKAIADLKEFVASYPNYADGHYTLALYMRLGGDHAGSVEHNRKAIELKPSFPEAHINAGVSLVELGDRKGARTHYEKSLEIAGPGFGARPRSTLARPPAADRPVVCAVLCCVLLWCCVCRVGIHWVYWIRMRVAYWRVAITIVRLCRPMARAMMCALNWR
jgi:tetratricopeptide (TPR) repeat protein